MLSLLIDAVNFRGGFVVSSGNEDSNPLDRELGLGDSPR